MCEVCWLVRRKMEKQSITSDPETGGQPDWSLLTGWSGVGQLPPLLRPEYLSLCCQKILGKFVVCMIVGMFVGITYAITVANTVTKASPIAILCRAVIYTEAAAAFTCLFTLQYLGRCFYVKRNPTTCFPIPDEILRGMDRAMSADGSLTVKQALRKAANGLGNIADPERPGSVYCVRCFVWRDEDGHHCSECNRCTSEFDHHCGVLGCCVGGNALRGNMWAFTGLLSMAAAGLVTMIATMLLCNIPSIVAASMSDLLSRVGLWVGGLIFIVSGGCLGYRGFSWFFYDRHAHLRVSIHKRRSA